jgi:hypothetical protein
MSVFLRRSNKHRPFATKDSPHKSTPLLLTGSREPDDPPSTLVHTTGSRSACFCPSLPQSQASNDVRFEFRKNCMHFLCKPYLSLSRRASKLQDTVDAHEHPTNTRLMACYVTDCPGKPHLPDGPWPLARYKKDQAFVSVFIGISRWPSLF